MITTAGIGIAVAATTSVPVPAATVFPVLPSSPNHFAHAIQESLQSTAATGAPTQDARPSDASRSSGSTDAPSQGAQAASESPSPNGGDTAPAQAATTAGPGADVEAPIDPVPANMKPASHAIVMAHETDKSAGLSVSALRTREQKSESIVSSLPDAAAQSPVTTETSIAPVATVHVVPPVVPIPAKDSPVADSKSKAERPAVAKSSPATTSTTTELQTGAVSPVATPPAVPILSATSGKAVEAQNAPPPPLASHTTVLVSPPAQKASGPVPMQSDPASNTPSITTIESAKPNQLEVGVRSSEYGWVKVRAEVNADGNVSAVLRASAPAAAELHTQSSALQSYLGAQSVNVHSVQIEATRPLAWSASSGTASENSSTNNSAGGSSSQYERNKPAAFNNTTESASELSADDVPSSWLAGQLTSFTGTGGWLSVRA